MEELKIDPNKIIEKFAAEQANAITKNIISSVQIEALGELLEKVNKEKIELENKLKSYENKEVDKNEI